MNLEFNGKLAVVSGSTAGIGLAIATRLAQEGTRVIINGRSETSVKDVVATRRSRVGGEIEGFAGDLSEASSAELLIREYPDVEILINNLGIFEPKAFEDIPDTDWMRFFNVNVLSGVRLARLVLSAMRVSTRGPLRAVPHHVVEPAPSAAAPRYLTASQSPRS